MYVLGLGDHIDCGSALLKDGRIIAAINDERLVREKMVFGVPRRSIAALLELTGVQPEQIDLVAVGTKRQHLIPEYVDFRGGWFGLKRGRFKQALFDIGASASRLRGLIPGLEQLYYLVRQPAFRRRRKELRRILRDEFGVSAPVQFIDHHYCHATSAYYSSDFGPDATILSIDGGGDGVSAKAFEASEGRIRELCSVASFDSLGAFYSYITQICGFKAGRHEGKITGLAAHGEPRYQEMLNSLLTCRDGHFHNDGRVFFHSAVAEIRRRLPDDFEIADLAASVQNHAEKLATEFARYWVRHTGKGDVALAGGLFGNVRINQEIHELPEVDRCFVHPGMSDAGMGVGAALAAYYDRDPRPELDTRCLDVVYLGPSYDQTEIEIALASRGLEVSCPEDIEAEVAALLAEGAVVARFDGRMEYGPRALGNRSILYRPDDPTVNDWLNAALHRTEFMPFAPAVIEENASRCFHGMEGAERTSRFMTITFDCKPVMRELCSGTVHIDGTARPQIVRSEDNPAFHRIIERFEQLTGIPAIINTSFNMHEEPIVCSPDDAIRAFVSSHLDYLAIGPFLARNTERAEGELRSAARTSVEAPQRAVMRSRSQLALPSD